MGFEAKGGSPPFAVFARLLQGLPSIRSAFIDAFQQGNGYRSRPHHPSGCKAHTVLEKRREYILVGRAATALPPTFSGTASAWLFNEFQIQMKQPWDIASMALPLHCLAVFLLSRKRPGRPIGFVHKAMRRFDIGAQRTSLAQRNARAVMPPCRIHMPSPRSVLCLPPPRSRPPVPGRAI